MYNGPVDTNVAPAFFVGTGREAMTKSPSTLRTLSARHIKALAKAAAQTGNQALALPKPSLSLGGNSGVPKTPSLVAQPKVPTLSTSPAPQSPQLGEGTAQQVTQTAQNLQQPAQPAQPAQAPVQPQAPAVPTVPVGPLGVPVMSKTGFLGHWGSTKGRSGAEAVPGLNKAAVRGWGALARAAGDAWSEDGGAFGKLGNASTPVYPASAARPGGQKTATFKRGFVEVLTAQGVASSLLRGWLSMGLRGEKLAAAIGVAVASDPGVGAEFAKLAGPIDMDDGTSPLKMDSPAAPKLDTKPPAATAPKVDSPKPQPSTPVPPPAQPTPPIVAASPQLAAGEDKPSAGVLGGEAKPQADHTTLNAGYTQADAAYQQAHAKWLELHRSKPGTPEEATAWGGLPALDQARTQAHAARAPHMGPEYATAKGTMDTAGAAYDKMISDGVPSTDPKYQAAAAAWQQAKAKHDEFVQKGLPAQGQVPAGAAKPDPNAAQPDPFGADYGAERPDAPIAAAPTWGQMFQRPGGGDYHAMDATRPTLKQQEEWESGGNAPYRQAVTQGLQTKLLPWLQQTGGAGLGDWAKSLDPHHKTTLRFGLTDEMARTGKELAEVTAYAKDPAKVKEFEAAKPVVFDPAKKPMFDAYAGTAKAHADAKAKWLAGYNAQNPDSKTQWDEMQRLEGELKRMDAAGVNAGSHHWYHTAKKTGELTQARSAYQQAYAQINYADHGSATPQSLKLDPNTPDADATPGQGTVQQRAAHLASVNYDQFYAEQKADAEATAEAVARGKHGDMPASYGHAQWKQTYDATHKAELAKRMAAIPTEEGFYRGRNMLIQQASAGPGGMAPKSWQDLSGKWLRPQSYERTVVDKPAVTDARGRVITPAVTRKVRDDNGAYNTNASAANYLYQRTMQGVVEPGKNDPGVDMFDRSSGAASFASGFAQADEATRAAYADRMNPQTRTRTMNNLFMQARSAAQAGDADGAERARSAAVFMGNRFNEQLKEFNSSQDNKNLAQAWQRDGGYWSDKGVPKPILDHTASLNPAMRRHVNSIGDQSQREYYKGLRESNDPRYQTKYDPAFGYEFIDRSVLNAGSMMAPIYRTAARGVGAVSGEGAGKDWLGGDTAQMKFMMDNPDKAHLVDWSGKPGEISMKAEDVALDGLFSALTLLPVGTAANMGRGMATTAGGLAGASTAMAGVEIAPIDQKYKPGLRVVAGLVGGVGGGAGGNMAMGAAQQTALKAFGQTGMVRATSTLARVETEVAKLTSAGKPIPADMVAKQQAARAELDTLRAAGGEKLVAAETAQKAALERVAALEARMKDTSLSPAFRSSLGRSPEYKDAVKNLRAAEKEMYGVYKGLDASKAGPVAGAKPPAGVADDAAGAKPAPGTAGNPYSLDAAEEAGKGFLGRWSSGWTDRNAWRDGLDKWTKGLSPAEVLKRRKDLLADRGPTRSIAGHANVSYNLEQGLQHLVKGLPEAVSRPINMAFRTVATPFRAITGEGALRNMALRRPGAAVGYGLGGAGMPFLGSGSGGHGEANARLNTLNDFVQKNELSTDPAVMKQLEDANKEMAAIKAQPGFTRTSDPKSVIMHQLVPGSWLPIQAATSLHDAVSDNKWRDKESPDLFTEMGNRWRGLKQTGSTVAEVPNNPLAAHRLQDTATRVVPNAVGDAWRGLRGQMGSGRDFKDELANTESQVFDIEDKIEKLPPGSPERAKLEEKLQLGRAKMKDILGNVDTRGGDAVRSFMALEDQKAGVTAKLQAAQAAAQANPADPRLLDQVKVLEGDLKSVDKQMGRAGLTERDMSSAKSYRAELDAARRIMADPNAEEGVKLQARKALEKFDIDPKTPNAPVGSTPQAAKGTRVFDPATGGFKFTPVVPPKADAPGGPTGPVPVDDADIAPLEADYSRSTMMGDTAGAKKAYDAAMAKAGGDPGRLPIEMFAPALNYEAFPGMDEAKFGAMIDGGAGAGTYAGYSKLRGELTEMTPKIQALQQSGQPVPPELTKAYEEKYAQLRQAHTKVQGRAVEHYETTVLRDVKERELPAFQAEHDQLMGAMKARPPGTPMSPEDQDRLVALRAQGQGISKKYLDHAMRKATTTGGFKEDGTPIKTVNEFLDQAGKAAPVLGADGQPVKHMVRQPDGSIREEVVTEPTTPVGKEIKARIDHYVLSQIQGAKTDEVDAQGRPVVAQHVPDGVGASIFGKMAPMEKMLTYAGLGLGAVGLMGAMFGFGGAWMPVLGLLGAAFGAHKVTGGDMGKLFKKDFWMDATRGQAARDGDVLDQFSKSRDVVTGTSAVGQVSLSSLKGMPQYADMVAGKMPSRQAVQYLAALQPQERARLQAELQTASPTSPLLPMIKQVDQFNTAHQGDLQAHKAMDDAMRPAAGPPPKPGQAAAPAAGVSRAANLQAFAAENGVKMNGELPDLTGKTPAQLGAMVARMPPALRAEATRKLDDFVIKTVTKESGGAVDDYAGSWKAIENIARNKPKDPNYEKARHAVQMRDMLAR